MCDHFNFKKNYVMWMVLVCLTSFMEHSNGLMLDFLNVHCIANLKIKWHGYGNDRNRYTYKHVCVCVCVCVCKHLFIVRNTPSYLINLLGFYCEFSWLHAWFDGTPCLSFSSFHLCVCAHLRACTEHMHTWYRMRRNWKREEE